ncbi:hypothetical protein [Streptomyces althioticus]|uniref:hypothetical protein n=1 Tax=Streptomyces althioticus TaxID=83380 RepID=UPI0033F4F1B3
MKRVFIVTLAERTDNGAALDIRPDVADMSAVVDGFEQLFPLMHEWSKKVGPEFTVYAMGWQTDEAGRLHDGYLSAWESFGSMYRLDRMTGGYVKVSDYSGTLDYSRPVK